MVFYNIRLGDVKPILMALPPEEERVHTLAWTFGKNAFGFTGGHYHSSWGEPNYRKRVLNAIVWSSDLEVPVSGIEWADPIVTKNQSILHAIAKDDPVDVKKTIYCSVPT